MSDGRGLPLLSGPPNLPPSSADASCRKCSKDLRGLFTRERRCNHCGERLTSDERLRMLLTVGAHKQDSCTARHARTIRRLCRAKALRLQGTTRCLYAASAWTTSLVSAHAGYLSARPLAGSMVLSHFAVTAGGRQHLKALPLARLKTYLDAYGIRRDGALEKGDLVDTIIAARVRHVYLTAHISSR